MECVVLAGGLGTRLGTFASSIPKFLVQVGGAPFAHHQLSMLATQGVDRVVLCIGHKGDMIRNYVGDGSSWGLEVSFVDEGDNLRGTGGALRLALTEGQLDDAFLVLYGDSYLPIDFGPVWQRFESGDPPALMTVLRNQGRWDRSNAQYSDGMVVRYQKGAVDADLKYIDFGLLALQRELIATEVPDEGVTDLSDVLHRLSAAGQLGGFEVSGRFYEVGSVEGLAAFEKYLESR